MVSKTKTAYVCNDCGADYRKWQGQCSECNAWNTLSEVRLGSPARAGKVLRPGFAGAVDSAVKTLADIALDEIPRISSGAGELDLSKGVTLTAIIIKTYDNYMTASDGSTR